MRAAVLFAAAAVAAAQSDTLYFPYNPRQCFQPRSQTVQTLQRSSGVFHARCSKYRSEQVWWKQSAGNGTFRFQNGYSKKCLQAPWGSAELEQKWCDGKKLYQEFQLREDGTLYSPAANKCVSWYPRTWERSKWRRIQITMGPCNNGTHQQVRYGKMPLAEVAAPEEYRHQQVRFKHTGLCLGLENRTVVQRTCTGDSSTMWRRSFVVGGFQLKWARDGRLCLQGGQKGAMKVTECSVLKKGLVFKNRNDKLQNLLSGKCAAHGNKKLEGAYLWEQGCVEGWGRKYRAARKPQAVEYMAELVTMTVGEGREQCATVPNWKVRGTHHIASRSCFGGSNQRWEKIMVGGDGEFKLRGWNSGMCLARRAGKIVTNWSCDGGSILVFRQVGRTLVESLEGSCVLDGYGGLWLSTCGGDKADSQVVEVTMDIVGEPIARPVSVEPREEGEPPAEDYTLQPPSGTTAYMSKSGIVTDWGTNTKFPPLYYPWRRGNRVDDYLMSEMIQGRMRAAMFPSRGTGEGTQNPSYITTYLRVLERNGMSADDFKISLFLDTANWRKRSRAAGAYDCDFSNHYSTARVIFTENLQPFFETLPRDRWYRIMGRPVVQVWGMNPAGGFSNLRGFLRERLEWVADECERRYGASERPMFFVTQGSITAVWGDKTIDSSPDASRAAWFSAPRGWGLARNRNEALGENFSAGCVAAGKAGTRAGKGIPRRNGLTFLDGLNATRFSNFTILESWKNTGEHMSLYRSKSWGWPTPNVYINHMARFNDPETRTMRLEAEGADEFHDTTPGNAGGVYYRSKDRDVDVKEIWPVGWAVGWTEAGEWLRYVNVWMSKGIYRFTLKYSSEEEQKAELVLDKKSLGVVTLPSTGGFETFRKIHMALDVRVEETDNRNITLVMTTGGINADWIFFKKDTAEM